MRSTSWTVPTRTSHSTSSPANQESQAATRVIATRLPCALSSDTSSTRTEPESVGETVAGKVEREYERRERDPGENGRPPRDPEVGLRAREHRAPRDLVRVAHAEEGEPALDEHRLPRLKGGVDHNERQRQGKQMAQQDPQVACAHRPG